MNKIIFFITLFINQSFAFDCYPDTYYYQSENIKNIAIKNDCNKFNRMLNFNFSVGYYIYAGKSMFQVPEVFNSFSPVTFNNEILKKLNVSQGRYQPIGIYDKNGKYKFVLALELDKNIYKYEFKKKNKNFSIAPLGYNYNSRGAKEEKHYPLYIYGNTLNFIAINHNSKAIHIAKDCGKYDTYLLTLKLPLDNEGTIEYKHLGYLYHPCKLRGFTNLEDFPNDEMIEFIDNIQDNSKYK